MIDLERGVFKMEDAGRHCRQLFLKFAATVPSYGGALITALFNFK